MVEAMGQTH